MESAASMGSNRFDCAGDGARGSGNRVWDHSDVGVRDWCDVQTEELESCSVEKRQRNEG